MTKHALVTGGNSGVGLGVAAELAKKGYAVWITGRSPEKGARAIQQLRALGAPSAEFIPADFTSFQSIASLLSAVKPKLQGRLDALIHSAGVLNSERRVSPDGLEETWASQFVGRYLVTEGLLEVLEATSDARVVFVGAPLMKNVKLNEEDLTLGDQYKVFAAAQQAYLACQIYMERFAKAHPKGPWINSGHVGLTSTDLGRGVKGPMGFLIGLMTRLAGIPVERAAQNFVALASAPELSGVTGFFFPKPGKLDVRQPMQRSPEERALFERIESRYTAKRQQAPAA
jgi:NAD(P)-dependent dehydrogenase (short-subunit alcohol dehydrogenase family)